MSKTIGQRIKEVREKKGLTQKELAESLGCAQTTVAGWEGKEQRLPSKHFLIKLTKALNITLDYLLNLEIPQTPIIPCYEDIISQGFLWPSSYIKSLPVSKDEYSETRFALHIIDSFMEPVILAGDYCIFEKTAKPQDQDIVVARFLGENNSAIVRIWREQGKNIAFLPPANTSLNKVYLFSRRSVLSSLSIEGTLVSLKRMMKPQVDSSKHPKEDKNYNLSTDKLLVNK